jgi:hypothetical protein
MYSVDYGQFPSALDANNCPSAPTTDSRYCVKKLDGSTITYSGGVNNYNITISKNNLTRDISHEDIISHPSFSKAYGGAASDTPRSFAQTKAGGYIAAGNTASYGAGGTDAIIYSFDAFGVLNWTKTWGGGSNDSVSDMALTSDGGVIVVGTTSSYGAGLTDVFLLKYDSSGVLSWSKTWGGVSDDLGHTVLQSTDGGYLVGGQTANYGAGNTDAMIIKYDSSGTVSWAKTIGGAVDYEAVYGMVQTTDGGYALSCSTASYGAGQVDACIIKSDSAGNVTWMRTLGGAILDYNYNITQTADGGYLTTGVTQNYGAGGYDVFVTKYTSTGVVTWVRTWGGGGDDRTVGSSASIIKAYDGGYVISGYTDSIGAGTADATLLRYDSSGTLTWNKTFGTASVEVGYGLTQASDGGVVVIGATTGYGAGGNDVLLAKFKPDGTMNNCSSPLCQAPAGTVTTPVPTAGSPTPATSSSAASVSTPVGTVTSPSLTTTSVVSP